MGKTLPYRFGIMAVDLYRARKHECLKNFFAARPAAYGVLVSVWRSAVLLCDATGAGLQQKMHQMAEQSSDSRFQLEEFRRKQTSFRNRHIFEEFAGTVKPYCP